MLQNSGLSWIRNSPPVEDPEAEGPAVVLRAGGLRGEGLLSSVLSRLLLLLLLHVVRLRAQSPGRSWVRLVLRRSGLSMTAATGSAASGLPRVSAELHTRKLKL